MFVQVESLFEVWIWYDLPNAASHLSWTRLMFAVAPRSTRIHCGSVPSAEAQRVVAFPSTALAPLNVALSLEDVVVGLPWESSGSAAWP